MKQTPINQSKRKVKSVNKLMRALYIDNDSSCIWNKKKHYLIQLCMTKIF